MELPLCLWLLLLLPYSHDDVDWYELLLYVDVMSGVYDDPDEEEVVEDDAPKLYLSK